MGRRVAFARAMYIWAWVLLGVSFGLGGCQGLTPVEPPALPTLLPTPTPRPSPQPEPGPATPTATSTAVPATAPAMAPAVTPFTVPWPTWTPTKPPVPPLGEIAYAAVHIFQPGPGSRVVSPIPLHMRVQTKDEVRSMVVELLGEDGRLLYRELFRPPQESLAYPGVPYRLNIPFEIRAETEWARLQVLLRDALNRPVFQQAVPLVLLRQGYPDFVAQEVYESGIVIQKPVADEPVFGGTLTVRGFAKVEAGVVEVLVYNQEPRVLYARTVPLGAANEEGYAPYEVEIPYDLDRPLQVRIVVQEHGRRIPGVMYVNSVVVWLVP